MNEIATTTPTTMATTSPVPAARRDVTRVRVVRHHGPTLPRMLLIWMLSIGSGALLAALALWL